MFASEVQVRLGPLLVGVYDDSSQMNREIELIAGLLTDAAEKLLPHVQPWMKDRLILLVVCALKAELLGQHGRKPGGRVRGHYLTKRVDCVQQ